MRHRGWTLIVILALVLVVRTDASHRPRANAVADWNAFTTELFVQVPFQVPETRILAIQHAAIHDALNTIRQRYAFYTGECQAAGVDASSASMDAAVAAASRDVLVALLPDRQAVIDERYAATLAAVPDSTAKSDGIALGQACAAASLARRADDGVANGGPPFFPCQPSPDCPVYEPTGEPGDYQFTPPFDQPPLGPLAALPGWGNVTPFVIDVSRHQLPGPDRLRSLFYAADLNYVKAIGSKASVFRTADQSQIAEFWYEASSTGWNRIANAVIRDARLNPWKTARILALVNFALADGYIAHFDVKYHYRFWRPITAIRQADTDGNPFTHPDPSWTPYLETPPVPDYPSGHTVVGAAVAEVLIRHFGNHVRFTTTSASLPGVTRAYKGFSHAAIENGWSRIYAGIHFVRAVADGYEQGQRIGRVVARQLPPVHEDESAR